MFFKQAVNQHELIRQKNIPLSDQLQKSYVATVEDTYRQLADLLLSQGRLLEAQQVLELLKLEELRGFTQNTRATWTGKELIHTDVEQNVINSYGSLLAFAAVLYECEKEFCADLENLYQQREKLERQYDQQVATLEDSLRRARTSDLLFYDPDSLADRAADIVETQPGSLLLYPLVLEDKLWLLWTTAGGVAGSSGYA